FSRNGRNHRSRFTGKGSHELPQKLVTTSLNFHQIFLVFSDLILSQLHVLSLSALYAEELELLTDR
ncbi:hypothetical protein, partial [Succinimonas amylolytica]|uniref:hypothetical protein n=1 Tax=Succinimonas amylolytica TaxID=83769 RepID=UPI001B7FCBAC